MDFLLKREVLGQLKKYIMFFINFVANGARNVVFGQLFLHPGFLWAQNSLRAASRDQINLNSRGVQNIDLKTSVLKGSALQSRKMNHHWNLENVLSE